MNCPRCQTELSPQTHAGMELDHCPGCAGVWLDKGEGEALSRPAEGQLAKRVAALDTFTSVDDSPPLTCPRCQGTMQREHYANSEVEIDRCDCGVWLDEGELEKITAYRKRCLKTLSRNVSASQDPDGSDFAFAPEDIEQSFARLYFRLGSSE